MDKIKERRKGILIVLGVLFIVSIAVWLIFFKPTPAVSTEVGSCAPPPGYEVLTGAIAKIVSDGREIYIARAIASRGEAVDGGGGYAIPACASSDELLVNKSAMLVVINGETWFIANGAVGYITPPLAAQP